MGSLGEYRSVRKATDGVVHREMVTKDVQLLIPGMLHDKGGTEVPIC